MDYFARLREVVQAMVAGDLLFFTDWRGDADERLDHGELTVGELMADAAARGVIVKGLFWRSHMDALHYSERNNREFANQVRRADGEVILDQRVPPMGCHHQKFVVARHPGRPERDVAFVGGIDLCHTRRDDARHLGDPQTVTMGKVWGATPAWHDMMVELHGPSVGDVEANFRERWEDPGPPAFNPINHIEAVVNRDDERADPLPPQLPDPELPEAEGQGTNHVQLLRTFPPKRPRFPFAPNGERSIARGYAKAVTRAESLVYIEDQYIWSHEVMACFADALAKNPELRLLIVLSTFTTMDTAISNASANLSRNKALELLYQAGGDRVAVFGIENAMGTPMYVHSKTCIIDDVWMTIGSDNVNLRSWTYDSELTCAILDEQGDGREPVSLRTDADPARQLPRQTRLELAVEHLGREPGDHDDLLDPRSVFDAFVTSAAALDQWYAGGRQGPRPPGQLRAYQLQPVPTLLRPLGSVVQRFADDPDGRPRRLRGTGTF